MDCALVRTSAFVSLPQSYGGASSSEREGQTQGENVAPRSGTAAYQHVLKRQLVEALGPVPGGQAGQMESGRLVRVRDRPARETDHRLGHLTRGHAMRPF